MLLLKPPPRKLDRLMIHVQENLLYDFKRWGGFEVVSFLQLSVMFWTIFGRWEAIWSLM